MIIPVVQVAVGVVLNSLSEVLIAQRPPGKSLSGLWEFPGGKLETNETVFQALQREFLEEVGINIIHAEPWLHFDYAYVDRAVVLNIWRISQFSGEPVGLESQQVQWVSLDQLNQFEFLPANKIILEKLYAMGDS